MTRKYEIEKISIKNYRSISDLKIDFKDNTPIVICGANNVGKTNFLRALDLFFSVNKNKFDAEADIPYHIAEGSRGQGYRSIIHIIFKETRTKEKYKITQTYTKKKDVGNVLTLKGKKNEKDMSKEEIKKFLNNFHFIFVESSNVDLPKIISNIVNEDILPLGLDRRRWSQKESLKKLREFIDSSKIAVSKIEEDITRILQSFIGEIEGIDSKNWNLRILFPEFEFLREAISDMIDFTLYDTNNRPLDSKGSGIQRIILLSLVKYISQKTKKVVIWGIDEPEAFLQPGLQKKVFDELKDLVKDNYIIITTHSHFFVDLNNLNNTFLFLASKELKEYARKPGEYFYKTSTEIYDKKGFEKIETIKKHMGIQKNDSWEIMPYNIIVEGEEDKKYLLGLAEKFSLEMPNIIFAGGVDRIKGLLGYISMFCEDISYNPRPRILCILDHDKRGKKAKNALDKSIEKYHSFALETKYIIRCDQEEIEKLNYEIEDFIYPSLLYDAVNKILRRKGYKSVRKPDREMRSKQAYMNKPILEFISDIIRQNNPDKEELDFNGPSLKKYVCKEVCELIKSQDISEYDRKYPRVKKFLEEIIR